MKLLKFTAIAAAALALTACGEKVEIPAASIGKVMTANGYKEGTIATSKFRLEPCWVYCDKLVILDVSDQTVIEKMVLLMPQDKLNMTFDLRLTLMVKPEAYDELFNRIPPSENGDVDAIPLKRAYETYAQQIIRAESRELLSKYTIAEIASSREAINAELSAALSKSIAKKTPFMVRYAGLGDLQYPEIIVKAQENAAERRESIQKEEAQLEISKVQLARQLQEQELQRKVDVEKARAEAEVAAIQSKALTPEYLAYRQIQVMEKLAESENKVFIPSKMLDSIAGQAMLGRQ